MIRVAKKEDAKECVRVLDLAMDEFSSAIFNTKDESDKFSLFEEFFKKENNRVSYKNVVVYELEKHIAGAICFYKGELSTKLDEVFNKALLKEGKEPLLKECLDDEYYIDSVAVAPKYRGRGIFKELFKTALKIAKESGYKKASLITKTPSLYHPFGFEEKERSDFYGEIYIKMVKTL
ncbi:GNAT family N-acetyltransferase [uncultured Campylobacter sp.]|uniref:GNAT family N-acetyltransferase n=1 Tax=uncultured Campylobacter sp. TaxID=218934 RepID=UPI00260C8247|nr:GNAT family N-acetyltransferase [uncultured Campylobacter sp.]